MLHKITKPNIMPALAKINIISMCNAVIMENPSAMTTVACECKSTMQRQIKHFKTDASLCYMDLNYFDMDHH